MSSAQTLPARSPLDRRRVLTVAAVCSLGTLFFALFKVLQSRSAPKPAASATRSLFQQTPPHLPTPSELPATPPAPQSQQVRRPQDEEAPHDCGECCHSNIDLEKELGKFVPGQAHYPTCPNDHPDRFQLTECDCRAKKQTHATRLQTLMNKQSLQPPRTGGFAPPHRGVVPLARAPSSAVDKWVVGKTQSLEELYELGPLIGEGQFGKAFTVTHKQTRAIRAVKIISKQQFWDERDQRYTFGELRDEIAILRTLDHPNIIKCFEVLESSGYLYLVMECCRGGELFDRIQAQQHYSEKDAVGVLRQIVEALKYLHQRKIAHCDLKPDNCLFLDTDNDSHLKIIDFGMSKHIQRRRYLSLMRGTPFYVAPEVLQGKYAEHCDIWSFGVVMFVMLFGYPPFYAKTEDAIYAKIERGFQNVTKPGYGPWFPANIPCSADAKDLIARCLNSNHASRLSAVEVLEHKFMNGGASVLPFEPTVGSNLSDFRAGTKLRVRVLSLMSEMLDQNELGSLKKIFKEIDTDGNGMITKDELKQAFRKQGVQDTKLLEQVEEVMRTSDLDGDGNLSYEELVMTAVQRKLHAKEERLWEAFCRFDKDHDGSITAAEVAEVLKVSEREARTLIGEIDKNGDGVVDYDEFRGMMMAKEEQGVES